MEYSIDNYRIGLEQIEREALEKRNALSIAFAKANNPHKKGDIIADSTGSIIIEEIKVQRGYNNVLPTCIYYGIELKKDGTPRVRQERRAVYQSNLIK